MPVNEGWIEFKSCVQVSPDGGIHLGNPDGGPTTEVQLCQGSFAVQETNSNLLHNFMVSNFKHFIMSVSVSTVSTVSYWSMSLNEPFRRTSACALKGRECGHTYAHTDKTVAVSLSLRSGHNPPPGLDPNPNPS